MFVQGPGALRAVDIYTGTILWTHRFDDDKEKRSITHYKGDTRTTYRPPAGRERDYAKIKRVGYNCAAVPDAVYLACGPECLRLDPASGEVRSKLAVAGDDGRGLYWDSLRVCDDVLLATAISADVPLKPAGFSREELSGSRWEFQGDGIGSDLEAITANYLVAVDRRTEKVLWRRRAAQAFVGTQQFWHPWGSQSYQDTSIAAAGGTAFCLDMLPGDVLAVMKRRGYAPSGPPRLLALEVRSGRLRWQQPVDRFCSLAYSRQCDALVTADVKQGNYLQGFRGEELIVRKGCDGSVLWKTAGVAGPVVLNHGAIYATAAFSGGTALEILTGRKIMSEHPLSGEPVAWQCLRQYGCNVPIGGGHLLTFRSATAAYYDLTAESGTVTLGGFRAGCSNTLIPAGGILNAPNYAYGCICNFQNNTSLALVHSPDADAWGQFALPPITRAVRRLGLGLAAPGDRRADDGTLWLGCEKERGGPVGIRVEADPFRPWHWHPSGVEGEGLHWVAASGIDGVRKISIDLSPAAGPPVAYRVAVQFVEPEAITAGDRVFDISLQGKTVAKGFDIVAQAGAPRRAIVRQWEGVLVRGRLEIVFTAPAGSKRPYAAVSGVEVHSESGLPPKPEKPKP
jgi:outer membrane protein assembly factor BamB